jgi:dipeptidase
VCDTFVALSNATANGRVLFAKNSDRDPNEAQELVIVEGSNHASGSRVRCTYIEVPQVKKTYTVLLSKPFWIWGAEMGANENGVVIGNEAVFTRYTNNKEPGLIGMDFLRLALERAASAEAALDVITTLLGEYGQSGNCGFSHPFFYDNSYLIADQKDAWVLETAGRQWVAQKVKDIRSISNILTIENNWDLASPGVVEEAIKKGWCRNKSEFSFRKCYSDFLYTTFGAGRKRQSCSTEILKGKMGTIVVQDMIEILRNHGSARGPNWNPGKALAGADICMHAGFGPIRVSQTTGSMVSESGPARPTFWVTGTAAPCLSIFKPVWIDSGLPFWEKYPEGKYDPSTTWWRGEELHRKVLRNYPQLAPLMINDRDQLEAEWMREISKLSNSSEEERRSFTQKAFRIADERTAQWVDATASGKTNKDMPFYYRHFRKTVDKQAEFHD